MTGWQLIPPTDPAWQNCPKCGMSGVERFIAIDEAGQEYIVAERHGVVVDGVGCGWEFIYIPELKGLLT